MLDNSKVEEQYVPSTIVELVDYNNTNMSMNELEEYFNKEEIPYTVRVDRDDDEDIEYHIITDDIPSDCNFQKDLQLKGDLSNVGMYIIYNK